MSRLADFLADDGGFKNVGAVRQVQVVRLRSAHRQHGDFVEEQEEEQEEEPEEPGQELDF